MAAFGSTWGAGAGTTTFGSSTTPGFGTGAFLSGNAGSNTGFGTPSNNPPPAPTATAGPGASIFMATQPGFQTTNQEAQKFNTFGANANTNTNPFGTSTQFGQQPAFGSTATQPGTTGFGLNTTGATNAFGTTPANAGSIFAQNTGTTTFGQPQPTMGTNPNPFGTQPNQPTGTGGVFGQNTTQGSTFFPSTTSTTSNFQNTGGFGSTFNQQPSTTGGFGSQARPTLNITGSAFGQPTQTGFGSSAFGQNHVGIGGTTGGFGGFGRPNVPNLGVSSLGGPQQQQQQPQPQPPQPNPHLQTIQAVLMKILALQQAVQSHAESLATVNRMGATVYALAAERFYHVFYNMVDPAQVALYTRPPDISEALWEKAVNENPNPKCMVPAFALGMGDLQKRVDAQGKASEAYKVKLEEIRKRLTSLSQRHVLAASLRTQKLTMQQVQLQQRVIELIQHIHLFIPTVRSSAIKPEEEALRNKLDSIVDIVRNGVLGRNKVNRLWGLLGQLHAMKQQEGAKGEAALEWRVADPDGLRKIEKILSEQQHGLAHLTKLLQEGLRDITTLLRNIDDL